MRYARSILEQYGQMSIAATSCPTQAVELPPDAPEPEPVPFDPPGPVIVPEPEPVPFDPPGPVIVPEPQPPAERG